MIPTINSFTTKICGLFTGRNNSSSVPQRIESAIKQVFQGITSLASYAVKKNPIYTLGGSSLFMCISAFAYRLLTKQRYPATKQESFQLLQQEVLEGQDIQKRANEDPHLRPLKTFIQHFVKSEFSKDENGKQTRDSNKIKIRHHVLYVLFGIKPALALFFNELNDEDFNAIEAVAKLNPSCKIARDEDHKYFYLSNESPHPLFDPRKYIIPKAFTGYNSILDAVRSCFLFNHKDDACANQFLSYLLGYGPSWEDHQRSNRNSLQPETSILSDEHYKELGIASGELSPEKYIEAGKEESIKEKRKKILIRLSFLFLVIFEAISLWIILSAILEWRPLILKTQPIFADK
jgi:hypothetical protein